jgi:hypothetical protein
LFSGRVFIAFGKQKDLPFVLKQAVNVLGRYLQVEDEYLQVCHVGKKHCEGEKGCTTEIIGLPHPHPPKKRKKEKKNRNRNSVNELISEICFLHKLFQSLEIFFFFF